MEKGRIKIIYEIFLISLIVTSAFFVMADLNYIGFDRLVWWILFGDVIGRLILLKDKKEYIKKNPFDFIALIPLDSMFQFARFVRLFKIIRIAVLLKRTPINDILKTNGLDKVLVYMAIVIILSAIPVTIVEPNIDGFINGIWWAVVTSTTVGYGDLTPVTTVGRIIAVILMIIGIALIGIVTSSIATYFLKKKDTVTNSTVEYIKNKLDDYENLSNHDYERLVFMIHSLKKESS